MAVDEKVQEITDKLEAGLKALFEGDNFKQYLNTMSKFHNYSFNNTMLIALQKPEATLVAGYNAWQNNFERHVKKDEHGIKIFAPAPKKIREEQQKTDPDTGELLYDKDGKPIMETVEKLIPYYKVVSVYDVSQTDGKPLPEIAHELDGSVEGYNEFFNALKEVSPVPVEFDSIADPNTKGFYSHTNKSITIREGMAEAQTVKTAVHEIAHAMLHDKELRNIEGEIPEDRSTKEVQAESIAYTVCQHFGIDTSDYSFGYLAAWGSSIEAPELKASLEIIRSTSNELINKISEILPERVLKAEIAAEAPAQESVQEQPKAAQNNNIIGNTEYKAITNKTFTKVPNEHKQDVIQQLESAGIHYSGRTAKNTTTFTLSAADKPIIDDIIKGLEATENSRQENPAEKAVETKPAQKTEKPKDEHIIGNTEYRYISDKKYVKFPNDKAAEIAKQLEVANIQFSGYVGKDTTTLTVSGDEGKAFVDSLSKQYDIEHSQKNTRTTPARESRGVSQAEIDRANSVNLPQFLMSQGVTLKRVGKEYTLPDHDSVRIHDNQAGEKGRWYRFSQGKGGDNIGFVREFFGKSFVEAVEMLNGGRDISVQFTQSALKAPEQPKERPEIHIEPNADQKRAIAYLTQTRGLDYNVISGLIKDGKLTQEAKTGNAVFLIKDENGKTVGAEKVGTSTENRYKGIATGSNAEYGFEVVRGSGRDAFFFESAIDMLSFMKIYNDDLKNVRLVSMAGVKPSTVEVTIKRHNIDPARVYICSDNDKAGNEFADKLREKYPDMKRVTTKEGFKDWNDQVRNIPAEKEKNAPEKQEIVWSPIPETEDENGKATSYSTKIDGNFYWISKTPNRRYDIEADFGSEIQAISEDCAGFSSRAAAEAYFEDNIEEILTSLGRSKTPLDTEKTQPVLSENTVDITRLFENFLETRNDTVKFEDISVEQKSKLQEKYWGETTVENSTEWRDKLTPRSYEYVATFDDFIAIGLDVLGDDFKNAVAAEKAKENAPLEAVAVNYWGEDKAADVSQHLVTAKYASFATPKIPVAECETAQVIRDVWNSKMNISEKEQPTSEQPKAVEAQMNTPEAEKPTIIGNTEFKDIPNKFFVKVSADKAEQLAAALDNNGIKFSGKIVDDKATFTLNKADAAAYKKISAELNSPLANEVEKKQDSPVKEEKTVEPTQPKPTQENTPAIEKDHKSIPVVVCDYNRAEQLGMVDEWRQSKRENRECANVLAEAISEHSSYERYGQSVDYKAALNDVLKNFPEERVALLLAHEVIPSDNYLAEAKFIDGRFSKDVQEWAKSVITERSEFSLKNFEYCSIKDKSHPVIINSLTQEFISMQKERTMQTEMENKLFRSAEQFTDHESHRMIGIYQLKSGEENHFIRFMPLDTLAVKGDKPDHDKYDLIAVVPVSDDKTIDKDAVLNDAFYHYNVNKPEDFKGHSLSVSDVIVINDNGEMSAHYVDDFGFKELPDFGKIHNPEIEAAQNTQQTKEEKALPSADELVAKAEKGETISLHEMAKAVKRESEQPKKSSEKTDRSTKSTRRKNETLEDKPSVTDFLKNAKEKIKKNSQDLSKRDKNVEKGRLSNGQSL